MGRVRTTQPPVGTPIDWSNPITKGLRWVTLPGENFGKEIVSGNVPSVTGTGLSFGVNKGGPCLIPDGSNTGYLNYSGAQGNSKIPAGSTECSVLIWAAYNNDAGANNNATFSNSGGGGLASGQFSVQRNQNDSFQIQINTTVTTYSASSPAGDESMMRGDGALQMVGGVWGDDLVTVIVNKYRNSTATSGTIYDMSSSRWPFLGWNATSADYNNSVHLAAFWDRKLTEGELQALNDNPWQIFKPKPNFALVAPQHELMSVPITEYNGPFGYTVDFSKRKQELMVATANLPIPYDDVLTHAGDDLQVEGGRLHGTSGYSFCHLELNSLWPFGRWQFSEAQVQTTSNTFWVGPRVFGNGDIASGGTGENSGYQILCAGTGTLRLYRLNNTGFTQLDQETGGWDSTAAPIVLRLEALDTGSEVILRWWVNGNELPPYTDSSADRIIHTASNSERAFTSPGVHFGNAGTGFERYVDWFRAGNMPERTTKSLVHIPKDIITPDLAVVEPEVTRMPAVEPK